MVPQFTMPVELVRERAELEGVVGLDDSQLIEFDDSHSDGTIVICAKALRPVFCYVMSAS